MYPLFSTTMFSVISLLASKTAQAIRERTFPEMNEAYLDVMGVDPPARITVGRAELARGAAVEIDAVAYKPRV